ncbi:MAG: ATP-binding cassette domain-containing protein [Tissierellia bacterium]|nr:ATP-binding cassette domain-containing protein [Tissierellia bacterium]
MTKEIILSVENLNKAFDGKPILKDLACQISQGEIVSIQGRSGEGKTTFLRCINGLETIDSGRIKIQGQDMGAPDKNPDLQKNMGLVFQSYNLFPHMTVWENLSLAPRFHKMEEDLIKERGQKLLEDLDLLDHQDKYPSQLSGGQRQRVAIARACILNPKILCFDEPTSALDEETRDQIQEIMEDLSSQGMTLLIVTHDKVFAEKISNRVLHIEEGAFREEVLRENKAS